MLPTGFCTVFCGWHNTNANSNPTEYATRPFRCGARCKAFCIWLETILNP